MKKLLIALAILSLTANVSTVFADGYGDDGCNDCNDDEVQEEPKHEDVEAGIGDMSVAGLLAMLGTSSLASTVLYKATKKLYIFDR